MKSSAPQDRREYVRIAVDLPSHPKLAALDDPAASWTHVVAICYSGQHFTDGQFPVGVVLRLAGVDQSKADLLVDAGLWHLPSHVCGSCAQPKSGHAVVHDYLKHQRSADEVNELREKRRLAGAKGAASRWDAEANGKRHGTSHASVMTNGWQVDGNVMAEVEVEEKKEKNTTCSSTSAKPPRDDVEQLCQRLYDRVIANGCKAKITKAWRDEARRLLDIDGRDLTKALNLIDWATNDRFWRSNIQSMPKFREKYDQLRLQAQAEWEQRRGNASGQRASSMTGSARMDKALAALAPGDPFLTEYAAAAQQQSDGDVVNGASWLMIEGGQSA